MRVYLYLAIIIQFVVDFLLFSGISRLAGCSQTVKRTIPASFLGAIYTAACLLPPFTFLAQPVWHFACMGIMVIVAFGWNRNTVRLGGMYFLLTMSLAGIASAFSSGSILQILLSAAVLWSVSVVGAWGFPHRRYVAVEITSCGQRHQFRALCDTGNTLRDPITGDRVLILGADAASLVTGLTQEQLRDPFATMLKKTGFHLVPYRSVGQPSGMLLAKRMEHVKIGAYRGSATIAFAPNPLGTAAYQALAGGYV